MSGRSAEPRRAAMPLPPMLAADLALETALLDPALDAERAAIRLEALAIALRLSHRERRRELLLTIAAVALTAAHNTAPR